MYDLKVRKCVVLSLHAILGTRCFDSVDGGTDGFIANRMEVEREIREMESPDEFENYAALMLQLATRDPALVGMVAVLFDERRRGVGGVI